LEFADENFAREVMQLFTTGLIRLNPNGTVVVDNSGEPIRVYTNDDIMEYARVWTGFVAQPLRGNLENRNTNLIDPMLIDARFRDPFPKMGLDRKYVGDHAPLCIDLPEKHFLKRGATYRLLGRTASPELQVADPTTWETLADVKRLVLQATGKLFSKLCRSTNPSSCRFDAKVVLDENIACTGEECTVDTLRTVEVANGIFYEYVRPPCVYQAFINDARTVVRRRDVKMLTCADPRTAIASTACCSAGNREWIDAVSFAQYAAAPLNAFLTFSSILGSIGEKLSLLSRLKPDAQDRACALLRPALHVAMDIAKIRRTIGPMPRARSK